jgi:hypothetical protein
VRGAHAPRDQCLAGRVEDCAGHGHALAEGWVSVVAAAPGVSHGDQQARARTGLMAEGVKRVRTDQALIHPAARGGDGAESGERDGACGPRACLLSVTVHA